MTVIYEYPREWYRFTQLSFQLRSASQVSPRPWAGGNSVYGPHVQLWMPKLTATMQEQSVWPEIDAFFSRLGGEAGSLRIGDASRLQPRFNRALAAAAGQPFSDGSTFTDGSGFLSGALPATCILANAASRGDTAVVIGGLPASTSRALSRGDLFEVRPNGIASSCPNLYQVMIDSATNSSGQAGVEIRPPLRQGLAAGDMVVLNYPTSVFHLIDDQQAEMQIEVPVNANFGFSLIEAIENA